MHAATENILKFFEYEHLPPELQKVSIDICKLALHLVDTIPEGPELITGLRKLLEAKDCFVRAKLAGDQE
jgi:hypothetical protein